MSTQSVNPLMKGGAVPQNPGGESTPSLHQSAGIATPASGRSLPPRRLYSPIVAIQKRVAEIEHHLKALKAEIADLTAAPMPIVKTVPTAHQIVGCVARQWRMAPELLYKKSNAERYTQPRRVAWFLMREFGGMSFPQIGRLFDMHHTTVIHGVQVFRDFYEQDAELQARVKAVQIALRVAETLQ